MRRVLLLGALIAASCGGGKSDDDAGKQTAAPVAAGAAAQQGGGSGSGKTKDALQVYTKVEDVVPPDEVPTIRHKFRERDFAPDLTGEENRDPFQSFVVTQPGVGVSTNPGQPQAATPTCTTKQQVATNYALRDLRLAAIITRGLRRFALFQDTADVGHLATRFDCLGKEKARVKEIGERTVTLEMVPDQAPNQAPRAPEEKSIPLYPTELPMGDVNSASEDQGQPITNNQTAIPPPPSRPQTKTTPGPMLQNVPVPPPTP